jgi:hypothetical protein
MHVLAHEEVSMQAAQSVSRSKRHAGLVAWCAAAVSACTTSGGGTAARQDAPPVPAAIELPATERPVLRVDARGTQNYACRASPDGTGGLQWALVGPEAELLDSEGKVVGRHYAGPSWESVADGSKVIAKASARADAPEPGAVPWLLLTATETSGKGMFADVKSVQRIDTHGGKAPATACSPGDEVKVPYRATYWFSRAKY